MIYYKTKEREGTNRVALLSETAVLLAEFQAARSSHHSRELHKHTLALLFLGLIEFIPLQQKLRILFYFSNQ